MHVDPQDLRKNYEAACRRRDIWRRLSEEATTHHVSRWQEICLTELIKAEAEMRNLFVLMGNSLMPLTDQDDAV